MAGYNKRMSGDRARTSINNLLRSSRTSINTQINSAQTEINTQVAGKIQNATEINTVANGWNNNISVGTVLLGKYVVSSVLCATTGEAVLYICNYSSQKYVAKVYRRASAIKDTVVSALKSIQSPYIARLYETGEWNGLPFEIIPYYRNGSLEGRKFTFEQLKQYIIPALNNGLKVLHDMDIIHKDLKPSNIMLSDDKKTVAIIDFGISSVREQGRTVLVTKTGMTPDYSAPETFHNLFLAESDYYSLGITIYELFCGHTPYNGVSQEVLEKYMSVQKLPFPNNFPKSLKELILGLTYNDITNRKDKANPNRRWTYEEVVKWCKGEVQQIPGSANTELLVDKNNKIPPITFMHNKYTDLGRLVEALGLDWDNGKKRLYRSALTTYFNKFNSDIANFCIDAEEAVQRDRTSADIEFFKCLYHIYPELKQFYWKRYHYKDMVELGMALLDALRNNDISMLNVFDEFIVSHLFSNREAVVNRDDKEYYRRILAIEDKYVYAQERNDYAEAQTQLYLLGYLYSKTRTLHTTYADFENLEALVQYVKHIIAANPDNLDHYSKELIYVSNYSNSTSLLEQAAPQFRAWLIVNGKYNLLKNL